jgi:hypothetical protein
MTDPNALRILDEYIDPEDYRVHEGDPPLRSAMLWGLFVSYTENYLVKDTGLKALIPEGAPRSGVTALEGLTAGRCLVEQVQRSYGWIICEARKENRSWAQIGRALGMSKQAAWELYQRYADSLDGAARPRMRDEVRSVAGASADD